MKVYQIVSNFLDSNTFVIEKGKVCFIVDCGADLEDVAKVVKGKKVGAIFLTHGHYDHSIFALQYADYFKCKIFANKNIIETLSDTAKNYGENFKIADFNNFVFLENDGLLSLNGEKIEYFYCPGHSKCSNCYLIDKSMFSGDVLFYQGIGRTDLYGGDKKEMLQSLKKIKNIDFENVYSGHDRSSEKFEQNKNISVFERFLSR